MKLKLYKPFEKWYHGGTIWIYSDPHFEDPDCLKMNEHWPTPEEQVNIINKFVGKNDTFICLGDIGNEEWVKKIKGYKVLLLGNHDKGVSNYLKKWYLGVSHKDKFDKPFDTYQDAFDYRYEMIGDGITDAYDLMILNNGMFDEVYEGPLFINEKICLSHEPINLGFGINIHGHDHNPHNLINKHNDNYIRINVCSNVREFKPKRIDDLISGFKTIDLHRMTINEATRKAKGK